MEFLETNISFKFDTDYWSDLIQYDTQTDFKKIRNDIPGTRAVDFIGVLEKNTLSLFEVKNFRGYRIDSKDRMNNGELVEVFAQKVRDTLSGIIGGARNSTHMPETWKKYTRLLIEKDVHIVCWVEEDRHANFSNIYQKRNKARASGLVQEIKRKLSWLTTKVMVADIKNNPYKDTLQVSFTHPDNPDAV